LQYFLVAEGNKRTRKAGESTVKAAQRRKKSKDKKREKGGVFAEMTQTEEFMNPQDPLFSGNASVQLGYLLNIKDQIIGHLNKKQQYLDWNFRDYLLELIQLPETSAEVRLQATVVFGSLCHGNFHALKSANKQASKLPLESRKLSLR
jgi:hypothetical protein